MMEMAVIGKTNKDAFSPLIPSSVFSSLFHEPSLFALGIVSDGKACCAIVCAVDGNTINILSLFAAENYRDKNLEVALLSELTRRARQSGVGSSICAYFLADCNYDLRGIYADAGFFVEQLPDRFYKLSLSKIRGLDHFNGATPSEAIRLEDLPPFRLREIERALIEKSVDFVTFPLSARSGISMKLSLAYFFENWSLKAVLLFDHPTKDGVNLMFAYASPLGGVALRQLLIAATNSLALAYRGDAVIGIPIVADTALRLLKKSADQAIIGETAAYFAVLSL